MLKMIFNGNSSYYQRARIYNEAFFFKKNVHIVHCRTIINPTEKYKRTKSGTLIYKSMFALNFKCQTNSVSGMLHND